MIPAVCAALKRIPVDDVGAEKVEIEVRSLSHQLCKRSALHLSPITFSKSSRRSTSASRPRAKN